MEYKDYYKIMGVDRNATQDDIKRAYRKLARKFHPDVSREDSAQTKFQEMQEAYEVLKDPEKRTAYDQLGANWRAGQDFRPPPGWDSGFERGGGFAGGEDSMFSEFFESLFGRRGRPGPDAWAGHGFQSPGRDHHARALIELEDAFRGATRSVTLQSPTAGDQDGVRYRQRTLSVRIPMGIKQGQHIRLSGQGLPGTGGGRAGDLYLEVVFRPHRLYRVDGADLYMDLPVAPWEAALGAKVKVPTPGGTVDLTIAPDSKSGTRLRLRGRGIPAKKAGDLYVTLQVAVPPARDEQAKKLYQQMREQMSFDPRAGLEA